MIPVLTKGKTVHTPDGEILLSAFDITVTSVIGDSHAPIWYEPEPLGLPEDFFELLGASEKRDRMSKRRRRKCRKHKQMNCNVPGC